MILKVLLYSFNRDQSLAEKPCEKKEVLLAEKN
jgi:hypothetical protein